MKRPLPEIRFVFNPTPRLPLNGKEDDSVSGYFDAKEDAAWLLSIYGEAVFKEVRYSHEISEYGGSWPFFFIGGRGQTLYDWLVERKILPVAQEPPKA